MRPKNGVLVGQASGIIRASSAVDAEGDGAELLEIAEDGFEQGCSSPTRAPSGIAWSEPGPMPGQRGRISAFDDPAADTVRRELARFISAPAASPCPKGS